MSKAQFQSLDSLFIGNTGSGKTRNLMHAVLMETNRRQSVIAVILSEESSPHDLTRVLLDIENDHALGIDHARTIFVGEENLMLVLRDVLHQGHVHLFIDAPSQTFFVTPEGTASKILRFTNPRFNEAAEIVNKLSVTVQLSALL